MTKKNNSKLLFSLCLIFVLVICALTMMACNKNKGESKSGTTTEVITGETALSIDGVTENKIVNIPSEYNIITPSASFSKIASIQTESGNEYWIITDGTTSRPITGPS